MSGFPDHGSQVDVDAANSFLGDQLLFGSSYPFRPRPFRPFRPFRQSLDDFLQRGFRENRLDGLLYGNTDRLFGLQD